MTRSWNGAARLAVSLLALGTVFLVGCGDDGRYNVSGTVTYKGELVPSGEIRFTPDTSQGNRGPMVLVKIKEGKYETASDKGIVGGPYQVRISGYAKAGNASDPTAPDFGKPLFEDTLQTVDFPKEDQTHDIVVEE